MNDRTKYTLILISSIVAGLIILLIAFSIAYVAIFTQRNISFDTPTIISVILAFFSIWISIRFFFQASYTNDKFYKNSYDHMKQQSELLARIEERFGEKFNNVERQLSDAIGIKKNFKDVGDDFEEQLENIEKNLRESLNKDTENIDKEKLLREIDEITNIVGNYRTKSEKINHDILSLLNKVSEEQDISPSYNASKDFKNKQNERLRGEIDRINNKLGLENQYKEISEEIENMLENTNWHLDKRVQVEIQKKYLVWLKSRNISKNQLTDINDILDSYFQSIDILF